MMVVSYFFLNIGGYEIDSATVALITALIAVVATLAVNALNATYFERKRQSVQIRFIKTFEAERQDVQLEVEKRALRQALYTEIFWRLRALRYSLSGDVLNFDDREKVKERLSAVMHFPVYDSALDTPALFYQLDDAIQIQRCYATLSRLPLDVELLRDAIRGASVAYIAAPAKEMGQDTARDSTSSVENTLHADAEEMRAPTRARIEPERPYGYAKDVAKDLETNVRNLVRDAIALLDLNKLDEIRNEVDAKFTDDNEHAMELSDKATKLLSQLCPRQEDMLVWREYKGVRFE